MERWGHQPRKAGATGAGRGRRIRAPSIPKTAHVRPSSAVWSCQGRDLLRSLFRAARLPPAPPRPAVNQQVPPLRARPTQLLSSHLRGTFWLSPFGAITNQSTTAVSAVFCVKSACRVLQGPPTACPGHLHRRACPGNARGAGPFSASPARGAVPTRRAPFRFSLFDARAHSDLAQVLICLTAPNVFPFACSPSVHPQPSKVSFASFARFLDGLSTF